jgi:hypothetical protein
MTKALVWLLALAFAAILFVWLRHAGRQAAERRRAEEARVASFMAAAIAKPSSAPPAGDEIQQRLLFDAGSKAGEANEPALAIQLYARLIARYPQGALVAQARSAVEANKRKLATVKARGPAVPG